MLFFVDPNEPVNDEVDLRTNRGCGQVDSDRRRRESRSRRIVGNAGASRTHVRRNVCGSESRIPAVISRKSSMRTTTRSCSFVTFPFAACVSIICCPSPGVPTSPTCPAAKVVGLSKLARVVEEVARRPQVQERLTQTIADLIEDRLSARGVAVVCEATHSCMTMRGVRKPGSLCLTSAMRGIFRDDPKSRAEVLGTDQSLGLISRVMFPHSA